MLDKYCCMVHEWMSCFELQDRLLKHSSWCQYLIQYVYHSDILKNKIFLYEWKIGNWQNYSFNQVNRKSEICNGNENLVIEVKVVITKYVRTTQYYYWVYILTYGLFRKFMAIFKTSIFSCESQFVLF